MLRLIFDCGGDSSGGLSLSDGCYWVPYLIDKRRKFPKATMWHTAIKNGGISVVDDDGKIINTLDRYRKIISQMQ